MAASREAPSVWIARSLALAALAGVLAMAVERTAGEQPAPSLPTTTPASSPSTSPAAAPDALPPRLDVSLRNVRWQMLSPRVRRVFVGPDGRAWYVLGDRPGLTDRQAVKRHIEREFARPDPQLVSAEPALFEPGGRVWFVHDPGDAGSSRRLLLGYDGEAWVEYDAPPDRTFNGACPGHLRRRIEGNNLFLDGRAFFVTQGTVHCFDGKTWASRELYQRMDAAGVAGSMRLIPEADGKGLIAVPPPMDGPARRVQPGGWAGGVWRWRGGKWSRLRLPPPAPDRPVIDAAPVAGGVWVLADVGRLWFVPFDAEWPELEALVAQLDDRNYRRREEAMEKLTARGPAAWNALRDALARTTSPEARLRIERVLRRLEEDMKRVPDRDTSPVQLGAFRVTTAHALLPDGAGGMIVLADRIDRDRKPGEARGPAQPGALHVRPDGTARPLADPRRPGQWQDLADPAVQSGPTPRLLDSARRLWLPGVPARAPVLIDLPADRPQGGAPGPAGEARVTAEAPDKRCRYLHAAAPDGTLFVGYDYPNPGPPVPLAVLKSGAPDNVRPISPAHGIRLAGPAFAVAEDGTVWAEAAGRGVVRFRGRGWEPVGGLDGVRMVGSFLPGRDGACLIGSAGMLPSRELRAWHLVSPGGVHRAETLERLLVARRAEAAAAFAGPGAGAGRLGPHPQSVRVQADKSGNLWVINGDDQNLKLVCGDQWINAAEAFRRPNVRREYVRFLAAVGDGSKVYVSSDGTSREGRHAALGEVKDGRPEFTPAPAPQPTAWWDTGPVFDAARGLWVSTGPASRRVTQAGPSDGADGEPVLFDRSGNLWLRAGTREDGTARLRVWREGRVMSEPTLDVSAVAGLFSDRPGSVYGWAAGRLVHFTESPDRPGHYAADRSDVYVTLGHVDGIVTSIEYSRLGFFAVLVSTGGGAAYDLHLVPLPGG